MRRVRRKIILALLACFAWASFASAQSSSVSIQVTDSGSVAWANGTVTFSYVGPANPTWAGGNLPLSVTATLNSSGAATASVPDTNTITPGPALWALRICPQVGLSAQCINQSPVAVTGSAPTLTLTPPAIVIQASSNFPISAYADAELVNVPLGFTYFNVVNGGSPGVRACAAVSGTNCTSWSNVGGSGASTPCGADTQIQFNDGGACGADPNLTWDKTTGTLIAQGTGSFSALSSGPTLNNFFGLSPTAVTISAAETGATLDLDASGGLGIESETSSISIQSATGVRVGSPTGGLKGANTINAVGLFVNGVAVSTTPISALTTGVIPQAGSATTLVNSSPQLDNGVTTANTLTYAGTGGVVAPSFATSGSTAGKVALVGQTSNPAVTSNSAGFIGPPSATLTAYELQLPATGPTNTNNTLQCGTPASNVSTCSFAAVSAGTLTFPATVAGTTNSGGIPYFSGATTLTSSAALTANAPVLGGGAGVAPSTKTFLTTNGTNEVDIGVIGGGNGVLGLNGTTSGKFTITAPSVAGTSTNAASISNVLLLPSGSGTNPAVAFTASTSTGMFYSGGGGITFVTAGQGDLGLSLNFTGEIQALNTGAFTWPAGTLGNASDTGLSRGGAGIVDVGTGASGSVAGQVNAAIFNATPTTVTGLGTAAAGNKGFIRVVSDSTTVAVEGQTCAGSSTNTAMAFSNGTVWKCF